VVVFTICLSVVQCRIIPAGLPQTSLSEWISQHGVVQWGNILNVQEAVKALRLAIGDTQQQFAARLGLAISTVVRYELSRPPKGPVLFQFHHLAAEHDQRELARLFWEAGAADIGISEDAFRQLHNAWSEEFQIGVAATKIAERTDDKEIHALVKEIIQSAHSIGRAIEAVLPREKQTINMGDGKTMTIRRPDKKTLDNLKPKG